MDGPPPAGWSCATGGWFELDKTDVPTADQLAELQKRTGGADAISDRPCADWDDVADKVSTTFAHPAREYKASATAPCAALGQELAHPDHAVRALAVVISRALVGWKRPRPISSREHDEKAALRPARRRRAGSFATNSPGDAPPRSSSRGARRPRAAGRRQALHGEDASPARSRPVQLEPGDAEAVGGLEHGARAAVGEYVRGKTDQLVAGRP